MLLLVWAIYHTIGKGRVLNIIGSAWMSGERIAGWKFRTLKRLCHAYRIRLKITRRFAKWSQHSCRGEFICPRRLKLPLRNAARQNSGKLFLALPIIWSNRQHLTPLGLVGWCSLPPSLSCLSLASAWRCTVRCWWVVVLPCSNFFAALELLQKIVECYCIYCISLGNKKPAKPCGLRVL